MKMVIALLFLAFFAAAVEAQQGQNVNEESNFPQGRSGQTTLYQTTTNTPGLMSFLGVLADAAGKPLSAPTSVTFSIYASATGGSLLWSETHNVVPTPNGTFGVTLGSTTPISSTLFKDNSTLYLGLKVGSDAEMSPRQRVTSAAFAFSAETASPREGYGNPVSIGTANASGTATTLARSDHAHQGLRSINGLFGDVTIRGSGVYVTTSGQSIEIGLPDKVRSIGVSGSPALFGDVTLAAGTNIALSQSSSTITIATTNSATFTDLTATGNTTLGDAATDTVTINGTLTFGNAGITTDITLQNGDSIDNDTNSQFRFKINEAGTVTILAADTDADTPLTLSSAGTGTLTLDPTGAGSVAIGSADVTSITLTTDDNAANDITITGGVTFNSDVTYTLAGTENVAISNTTGSNSVDIVTINITNDDGAANTQRGLVITNLAASTSAVEALIALDNADAVATADGIIITATGAGGLTDGIQVGSGTQAITNAINIASIGVTTDIILQNADSIDNDTNSQFRFKINEAGTVTILAADTDADTPLTISSAGTGTLTLDPTGAGSLAIGSVDVTGVTIVTDDNAANDITITGGVTFNSDTTHTLSGTENISITHDATNNADVVSIKVTPAGTNNVVRGIFIQQESSANTNPLDSAIEINNADNDVAIPDGIKITSSGGGAITTAINIATTAVATDITLQNADSIDNNTDGSFTFTLNTDADVTIIGKDSAGATNTIFTTTGAGSITIGTNGSTSAITLATDGTGDAEVVLPTGAISSTEILDGTITTDDIATDTITAADIAADAVGSSEIAGPIAVTEGGTGTATQFTAGSVVFAGASGVYSQNNSKLFWDNTNNRLGVGTTTPGYVVEVIGSPDDGITIKASTRTNLRLVKTDATAQTWLVRTDDNGHFRIIDETPPISSGLDIDTLGNVIIGAIPTTVFAKLHVEDTGGSGKSGTYAYLNGGAIGALNPGQAPTNSGNSIFGSGRITAGFEFNAFSDARIKNIQGVSDGAADLNTLRQIEIVDFRYKDRRKDDGLKKKVIGQQLAKVYPQAVHFMTAETADIMRDATVNGGVITLPGHGLKTGERVKLIFEEGDVEKVYKVLSVTQDTFTVDESKQGGVFVYGKEVDDFHIVDYEAIAMLNVSATQELAVRLDRLEEQQKIIAAQQKQIESLQAEIKAIWESLTSASSASEAVGLRK